MKYIILLTIGALVLFIIFPNFDLKISRIFYSAERSEFLYNDNIILVFFYNFIYFYTAAVSAVFISLLLLKIIEKKPAFLSKISDYFSSKQIIFILITLLLGPGLVVHQVVKPLWDRARPLEITEFGGEKRYSPPLEISNQNGHSFISGHAAMGFYTVAFAFLFTGTKRKILYIFGLCFGSIISLFRIMQGAHFLSDTVFAALVSLVIIHLFYYLLLKNTTGQIPQANSDSTQL